MTKEEKKLIAIFAISFIAGMAIAVSAVWALYALLAHFMGGMWAVITIACAYLVGLLSGLCALKDPNGNWRFNGWCACTLRKWTFWELDLLYRISQIMKGSKPAQTPESPEVVDAATVE